MVRWVVVMGVMALGAGVAAGGQLCPNPRFAQGLAHWNAYQPAAQVKVVAAAGRAGQAVEIDARGCTSEAGLGSELFAVQPLTRYRLGGLVRRLAGQGRYKISLEWLDGRKRHLGYENSWTGVLAGDKWERHRVEVSSPAGAREACVLAGVDGGCAAQMTDFGVAPLPPGPASLAMDLWVDPLPAAQGQQAKLYLRIENRQVIPAQRMRVEVSLPAGVSAPGPLAFAAGTLVSARTWEREIPLEGSPRSGRELFRLRVSARFAGREASFEEATRPFVTRATEVETATAALEPPVRPATKVKLGCYYFPVMLDWDRAGWGVRRVEWLRPRLGYYDESRPEVADWHIKWAVEHGLSFFIFDWYYNGGMCYLNDALERGFLGSRFAGSMEFCIDWCNEGQCQEFRPLDFSPEALAGFMHLVCKRYFARPNYLRAEGKPVVLIHQADRIMNAYGGWEGCRGALEGMRAVARGYGERGVYFVAVHSNAQPREYDRGGFDAVTAYTYGFAGLVPSGPERSIPYPALLPRHRECWAEARQRAHRRGLDYIPTAWVGWDDEARAHERSVRTAGNTPAAFRRMLEALPRYVDRRPGLALVEAWNEWGEGSVLEPGGRYGFGYASALRDALTGSRGPYRVPVPSPEEVARLGTTLSYDEVNDIYYRRYAAELGMGQGLRLEFSPGGVGLLPWGFFARGRVEDGCLQGESTGEDPVLLGPPAMGLAAERVRAVVVSMAVTGGTEGQLFWCTGVSPDWSEERSVKFPLVADGQRHEYRLEVGSHPQWRGTVDRFRFDPTNASGKVEIARFETVGR